ncbi:MAG TPA: ATP-binding protein [Kofleriaceae bacterium]|nr:ATP-binding protein [Kofleriaceae bacterium]
MPTLRFRHRIALLVSLPAVALIALTAVTLILGRLNKAQLTGIETHYLPLIELDRDLAALSDKIPRKLADAADSGEEAPLAEADQLADELRVRVLAGAPTITANGGDPAAVLADFERYYGPARALSAALTAGASPDELAPGIDDVHAAQARFAATLEHATSPDRDRLTASFRRARDTQNESLWIAIIVAAVALALMFALSWRLIRRTVGALGAVTVGVERMARGDFSQRIEYPPGDELGDLARQANRTAAELHEYRDRVEREAWIKTGLTELADEIAGELDPAALAAKAIEHLTRYLGARGGATRAIDDAGAGADDGVDPGVHVERRDGRHVVVVPLVHHDRVGALLELTTDDAPDDRTLEFLGRVRSALGVAFQVALARQREVELLVETQRQAIEVRTANKELEAFSYSVSHDLRTPLRGIDGFSQALLEDYGDQLDATGKDYLRRIRGGAQRMAELIDDLLRLSRVSRADFRRERVDLSAIVTTIEKDLRRTDPARAIELRTQPDVHAFADPRLVRITLENLIGNAWKFTSKTAAPVIEFGARTENGEQVLFVRDNGAGLDMAYAERLFGAFQRLHTEKEFPGTGIGLATVQRIIHRHGGRIWVDAAVGRGATFYFTLPGDPTGAPRP